MLHRKRDAVCLTHPLFQLSDFNPKVQAEDRTYLTSLFLSLAREDEFLETFRRWKNRRTTFREPKLFGHTTRRQSDMTHTFQERARD